MKLKELRNKEGISRKELADMVDLKPRTIQAYEAGERGPNIRLLICFADLFGVTVDYLIGRSDADE